MAINTERIINEKDPFLRVVWAEGYDEVIEDRTSQQLMLVRKADNFVKRISRRDLLDNPFTIREGLSRNGEVHKWISEADGSCKRLRNLIAPN